MRGPTITAEIRRVIQGHSPFSLRQLSDPAPRCNQTVVQCAFY